jgi:hypothetical protein
MSDSSTAEQAVLGSCFCKAVRFEIHFPTDFVSHCHCESCRRSHGAALVTWTGVPLRQFKYLKGQNGLRRYKSSPGVTWIFCENCGTSLLYEHASSPDKIYITVANLEGPLDRFPEGHVSYEEHVPWLKIADGLPKFREKSNEIIPE